GRESESDIGQSGRDKTELIGHRAHGTNLEVAILKLCPFAALDLAAAGEDQCSLQAGFLAGLRGLSVVEHSAIDRTDDRFFRSRVADSAGDRTAIFDIADGNAKLRNARDKLACAIERVDDPDAASIEA